MIGPTPPPATGNTPSVGAQVSASIDQEKEEAALSDFNDFLTLLTAQMRNQDPTKPLDSTQFVEQLASFASVEQQVGSNKKLNALIEQGKGEQINELATWVGRNIEAGQALFALDGNGITVDVPPVGNAASTTAIITDSAGNEVARLDVEPGAKEFEWDGKLENGVRAPNDNYAFAFNYTIEGQSPRQIEVRAEGNVVEARLDAGGSLLFLDSGAIARVANIERVGLATTGDDQDT